jgi:hypothetical protein
MNTDYIDKYIDELLKEKGFDTSDIKKTERLKSEIESSLSDYIDLAIAKNVPEDKLEEFDDKIENATDKDLNEFILKNVPEVNYVISLALTEFRNIYLKGK